MTHPQFRNKTPKYGLFTRACFLVLSLSVMFWFLLYSATSHAHPHPTTLPNSGASPSQVTSKIPPPSGARSSRTPELHDEETLVHHTTHFTFQYPRSWKRWVQPLLQHAEKDHHNISQQLHFHSKEKLLVKFAQSGPEYAKIQPFPWHPPSYIAGLAYPSQGVMTLRLQGIDGTANLHQTFVHELSHLLLARAVHHRSLPLWFVEGMAMLHSQDFGNLDRMWLLASTRLFGQWPSLSSLTQQFPESLGPRKVAYAVSFDMIVFLQSQTPELLPRILQKMRTQSVGFYKAIEQQTGLSWAQLEQRWQERVKRRYSWLVLLSQESLIWFIIFGLIIWSYVRIRRKRQEQLKQWTQQDRDEDTGPWYPPSPRKFPPSPFP